MISFSPLFVQVPLISYPRAKSASARRTAIRLDGILCTPVRISSFLCSWSDMLSSQETLESLHHLRWLYTRTVVTVLISNSSYPTRKLYLFRDSPPAYTHISQLFCSSLQPSLHRKTLSVLRFLRSLAGHIVTLLLTIRDAVLRGGHGFSRVPTSRSSHTFSPTIKLSPERTKRTRSPLCIYQRICLEYRPSQCLRKPLQLSDLRAQTSVSVTTTDQAIP